VIETSVREDFVKLHSQQVGAIEDKPRQEGKDMDAVWDGITRPGSLTDEQCTLRQKLADCCKAYSWAQALPMLSEHPELVNVSRPGGKALYAPLHQAAHGGAPESVVQLLLELGAWRTLQNARGERPIDIARRRGHHNLLSLLEPRFRSNVPMGILLKLQSHFHTVIRSRADRLVEEHRLRLPELEPLLELDRPKMWFAVPGMCGGFSYWLANAGVEPKLVTESWCRVAGGSGQRHEITSSETKLVDEGFV
jgi:hypothetical protein